MDSETMANTIRSRFKTSVADPLSLVTQYDNQTLDNPDNANWCRLTIKSGETMQVSIGSPSSQRERTRGVMIAQLFGPVGQGDGALRGIADSIKSAFRRVTDSGVTFLTPSIEERGLFGDAWQVNVICPFYADNIG